MACAGPERTPIGMGHAFFLAAAYRSVVFLIETPLISKQHTTSVGKYLVSPYSKQLDDGRYGASVSIRSGRGSASTDRVMRFKDPFDSADAAHRYAHEQGLIWVAQSTQPQRACATA